MHIQKNVSVNVSKISFKKKTFSAKNMQYNIFFHQVIIKEKDIYI